MNVSEANVILRSAATKDLPIAEGDSSLRSE
jgi:hypothetical protein